MKQKSKLNLSQLNELSRFIAKHHIIEIELNKAETQFFFDYIDEAYKFERSRVLLQPAFAECYFTNENDNMVVIIVQRTQLLRSANISWEDGYDDRAKNKNYHHVNPFTRKFIEIFIDKMSLELLFDKLAIQLSQRFPLSQGQAKAVMTKYLGFKLDSGTRSFLHDLRKKIRKYQSLVSEFQEYVLDNEMPSLIPIEYMNELISSIESGNIDQVLDKVPEEWINRKTEDRLSEFKSILEERKMHSESDQEIKQLEGRLMMQNQPKYEFVCQECDTTIEFEPDNSDTQFRESPQHHGKPMILKIEK